MTTDPNTFLLITLICNLAAFLLPLYYWRGE